MLDTLKKLNFLLSKRDKQFLLFLVFLSITVAIIETIGVSAIMPFIAVASDFNLIYTNEYYSFAYRLFGFTKEIDFVLFFGVLLIVFYIFRGVANFIYFYLLAKFAQGRYYLIAYRLYSSYLAMPYRNFVNKNSSFLTKTLINEASSAVVLINQLLIILSEIFVIIFIYLMLVFTNWKVTLGLSIILVLKALFLTKTVSKKIKKAGVRREEFQKDLFEIINSTFGNFKIIKLVSNSQEMQKNFKDATFGYANTVVSYQTLSSIPRLLLELIGFSLIILIVLFFLLKYNQDITAIIPLLSMYILALYRLMPSVNRIMSAYNGIVYQKRALDIVHADLIYEIEDLGDEKISFKQKVVLQDIEFSYGGKKILNNLSLSINSGEKIAFIGESGSGKSTLVDILIGLYRPENGNILIDNNMLNEQNIVSWRQKVGYIPQQIYLFDGNVAENISLSKVYNTNRVEEVLRQAKIFDFLQGKEGVETRVGEGGIQLSGGQRQRIAIARALYHDPQVLVLDEATSALDENIEAQIMDEIYEISKDKTLIIVAHRLSTIRRCDKIYKLENGKIICQ